VPHKSNEIGEQVRTNREWITLAISHKETRSVPYNFLFSPKVFKALSDYYKTNDLEEAICLPIRMNGPRSIKPLYADPDSYGPTIRDEFNVVWSTSDIDRGSPIGPCLNEPSLKKFKFPDPTVPYRFESLSDWCMQQRDNFRVLWIGDLWERATFMRGMEELLTDLYTEPDFVENLLESLADYILKTMDILFGCCEFEAIALSDDYGTQQSLIMNPVHWRKFVRPQLKKIYASAKRAGKTVFHHSCGNIVPIIPDMIDLGLDILHPIQPEAMDIFELKREFGKALTFCGGMPTQRVLPNGTPGEVRETALRIKTQMSSGGGYIFEPGITLLADVPFENILALIEAASSEKA
jgi:uroporphyrinogen decarboxylase